MLNVLSVLLVVFALVFLVGLVRGIKIVPNKTVLLVERLGKYNRTLEAGFHVLFPFIDKVRYKQTLKEQSIDVPAQDCFTKDNVKVRVDGVLYMYIFDPFKASYEITNYNYATILLAQTTMRSVIGQLDLDDTFEARERINAQVVKAVDEASDPWGVKVTRYEIQNIHVSTSIMEAMENQMKAEREKRAEIARSEGEMETMVNLSRATYEECINIGQGEREKMINEAEGEAKEIIAIAQATSDSIKKVSDALALEGGEEAADLTLGEQWINCLKQLDKASIVLKKDIANVDEAIKTGW
ncbi:MAG: SPFH domain-containing protein [Treponema sp.]